MVAYETWRKGAAHAPDIDYYMPIGKPIVNELTEEQLNEIWNQYGKYKKHN